METGKRDPPRKIRDWMIWRTIRSISACPPIANATLEPVSDEFAVRVPECLETSRSYASSGSSESSKPEMTPESTEGGGTHIDTAWAIHAPPLSAALGRDVVLNSLSTPLP